jgi:hypothetical protein
MSNSVRLTRLLVCMSRHPDGIARRAGGASSGAWYTETSIGAEPTVAQNTNALSKIVGRMAPV